MGEPKARKAYHESFCAMQRIQQERQSYTPAQPSTGFDIIYQRPHPDRVKCQQTSILNTYIEGWAFMVLSLGLLLT